MSASLSITEAQIFTALGNVLQSFGLVNAAGASIPIRQGQANRVASPPQADYALMWPLLNDRLSLNVDAFTDSSLTGSITGSVLTVTAVLAGSVAPGVALWALGQSAAQGVVLGQLTGVPGGIGTYQLAPAADLPSGTLYCGSRQAMQPLELTIQVDIHGPASSDNATRVSTQWRNQIGVNACQAQGAILAPLYNSSPRQIPFINDQDQYEQRWSLDLCMQVNPVLTVPQQFASNVSVTAQPVQSLAP